MIRSKPRGSNACSFLVIFRRTPACRTMLSCDKSVKDLKVQRVLVPALANNSKPQPKLWVDHLYYNRGETVS